MKLKTKYIWIWESELLKFATEYNQTLKEYLNKHKEWIRFPDGDSGDKKMYVRAN